MKLRTFLLIVFVSIQFVPFVFSQQESSPSELDACSYLSTEKVEEVFGERTKAPKATGAEEPQPKATTAALSACTWESVAQRDGLPKRSVTLWVRRAPAAINDSPQVMEGFRKDPQTGADRQLQAIPGLGDLSFWSSGKLGAQTRAELDAMKKDVVVQVILIGYKDAITDQSFAKQIVEDVWQKLRID